MRSMALDAATLQKITTFLNEKWKAKTCLQCAGNDWDLHGYIGLSLAGEPKDIALGGQVLPCVAVVCKNCGNTLLINVIVAGLVSK